MKQKIISIIFLVSVIFSRCTKKESKTKESLLNENVVVITKPKIDVAPIPCHVELDVVDEIVYIVSEKDIGLPDSPRYFHCTI